MATFYPSVHIVLIMIVIALFVGGIDSTCTCGTCEGPSDAYCWKNHVQCQSGSNDNPLTDDVNKVLEAYIKVLNPDSDQWHGIHVKEGDNTIFVVEDWAIANKWWVDLCTYVCQELDDCVAVEKSIHKQGGSWFDVEEMWCSYAYGCDSVIPWEADMVNLHGLWLDTAHHAKTKSLPAAEQGINYVSYSEATPQSDIKDVALPFDYFYSFAVVIVASLFFGIGICLGLAMKKYPKQVQYPQL